jgi:PLP dependent protein
LTLRLICFPLSLVVTYEQFAANCDAVRLRIESACKQCGRNPSEVRILPVTKTNPVEAALYAYRYGMRSVSENKVQEGQEKKPLAPADLRWEFIGHLQSNKVKPALKIFDIIQTVDSIDLILRMGRIAEELNVKPEIYFQVNSGHDPAKFGCEIEEAPLLLEAALGQSSLRVVGLMAVPPIEGGMDSAKRTFDNLRICRDELENKFKVKLPELSIGMSGDMEAAVIAGSTCVRLGSSLYGPRTQK